MIRSILVTLFFVASASAFSVVPPSTSASRTSSTTLFVKYANLPQMALAQDWGPAILQGGSDVGFYMNSAGDECDPIDPDCFYIEPECDVNAEPGCLVNAEMIGPYKVQGGSTNDWSSYTANGLQDIPR